MAQMMLTQRRKSAIVRQENMSFQKRKGIRNALRIIAVSPLTLIIMVIISTAFVLVGQAETLQNFVSTLQNSELPNILFFLLTIAPIWGLFQLAIVLFRKTKKLECPFCGEHHTVLEEVTSYLCKNCYHVFRVMKHDTKLMKVLCPQCHNEWASGCSITNTNCFACGLPFTITDGIVILPSADQKCSECSTPFISGMYCCPSCGKIVKPPLDQDDDTDSFWNPIGLPKVNTDGMTCITLQANSAIGWMIRAISVAEKIRSKLFQLGDNKIEGSDIFSIRDDFIRVLESLDEVIVLDENRAENVRTVLEKLGPLLGRYLLKSVNLHDGFFFLGPYSSYVLDQFNHMMHFHRTLSDKLAKLDQRLIITWPENPWGDLEKHATGNKINDEFLYRYYIRDIERYKSSIEPLATLSFNQYDIHLKIGEGGVKFYPVKSHRFVIYAEVL